ncbi:COG4705 family protein [Microlunatus ginsengisoli]|uniref:Membrane-anchored protein n=1 Tax=Microlunatus ginsengisoli TaxID=363863 RepID=A0ABP7AKW4_9ACTN
MSETGAVGIRPAWSTKVPAITATFWVIKILSTTVGETFADFLSVDVGLGTAVTDLAMLTVLAAALAYQLRTRRYTPWIYWLCVVLVSIVGTQITDFFTDTLGVSLYISTAVFTTLLAAVFVIWYRQEHTLAITSIDTRRREAFYWAAILVTFALGTAAGDLATEALSLGFRNGVLIFGALLAATFLANRMGANSVATFWIAYVLTRPLGASLGDLLTQDPTLGGLGLGATMTSVVFFLLIIVLVAREQVLVNRHGVVAKGAAPHGGRRADVVWAGAGIAAVLVVGLGLSSVNSPSPATSVSAGSTATQNAAHPTTALGDVSRFATIATDVQAEVAKNDLPGATSRVKDLEVAWDSAEAGLKPRDSADWHTLDSQIDGVLTSLRASSPNQADCAANLKALVDTLNRFDGV